MGILTLLDTEYLDEFDYGNLAIKPQYGPTEEEPEVEKGYIANPNNRYTYRPMLEIFFPD
jgi:hypothetical protein